MIYYPFLRNYWRYFHDEPRPWRSGSLHLLKCKSDTDRFVVPTVDSLLPPLDHVVQDVSTWTSSSSDWTGTGTTLRQLSSFVV
jgi:hypothetical protein